MADWQAAYLAAGSYPDTPQNRALLTTWQHREGGHTNNNATYNYMNTTWNAPGSKSINSVGVKAYSSLAQGAQAWASTLKANRNYQGLDAGLRAGNPYTKASVPGLATWLSGSPNSSSGVSYATQVLGQKLPPGPTNPQVSAPAASQGLAASPAGPTGLQALRSMSAASLLQQSAATAAGAPADSTSLMALALARQQFQASAPTSLSIGHVTVHGVSPGSSADDRAVTAIKSYIGTPYVWGGSTPKGFDCSGLIQYVWKQNGVNVPRTSQQQWKAGSQVQANALRPGDAVFFAGSDGTMQSPGHVGMYIGDGKFVESPHTGSTVHISTLAGRTDYVGARRYA